MRKTALLYLFLLVLVGAATAANAQTNFVVEARPDNNFSPEELTIEAGDSVTFRNAGGIHNVVADDGSFRCANGCDGDGGDGTATDNAWEFTLTFNDPGVITYNCELHVGLGMRGSITVLPSTTAPGTLRFDDATLEVDEGDGSVTVTVNREGGSDGPVLIDIATSDGSADGGTDYFNFDGVLAWDDGDDAPKSIDVPILDDNADENDETFNVMISNPVGDAAIGDPSVVTVTILDDDTAAMSPGRFVFATTSLSADEDAGNVQIEVSRLGGDDGAVSVDYSTANGSANAGMDYRAASGTLNWADGDSARKTFNVRVLDDNAEENNETVNLMLSNPNGGATLGGNSSATLTIEDNDASTSACNEDNFTLCLGRDDRFEVSVEWSVGTDGGDARAVDIGSRDAGLFYFFGPNNIEMLFKALDGCGINNHFWVLFAATTDVGFTVTITDTETSLTKTYSNPQGRAANAVIDLEAFDTCP